MMNIKNVDFEKIIVEPVIQDNYIMSDFDCGDIVYCLTQNHKKIQFESDWIPIYGKRKLKIKSLGFKSYLRIPIDFGQQSSIDLNLFFNRAIVFIKNTPYSKVLNKYFDFYAFYPQNEFFNTYLLFRSIPKSIPLCIKTDNEIKMVTSLKGFGINRYDLIKYRFSIFLVEFNKKIYFRNIHPIVVIEEIELRIKTIFNKSNNLGNEDVILMFYKN